MEVEHVKSDENFDEDINVDDFNVKSHYKQYQDNIEEKEQDFIQHIRTLSILSNNLNTGTSSNKLNGKINSNEPSTARSKGVQLIDEFLDLRKLRRQFVTALYNHIEIDSRKIKSYQTNIKTMRHNRVEHEYLKSSHYQDILKALDTKEKELFRIKHHQEQMIEHARQDTKNEYALKYQNAIDQLTIHYESKLKLLETKLVSVDTENQAQNQKAQLQTVFDSQRRASQANEEKTIQWQEKEKQYIDKLQKFRDAAVAITERERTLKEDLSNKEIKIQVCYEKIELLKAINSKLEVSINDEKNNSLTHQVKVGELQAKLAMAMAKLSEFKDIITSQKERSSCDIAQLKLDQEKALRKIDEKVRNIIKSKDDMISSLQNQYDEVLQDKIDIESMMNDLTNQLKKR